VGFVGQFRVLVGDDDKRDHGASVPRGASLGGHSRGPREQKCEPVQVVAEVFRLFNPARLLICHESWPDLQAHWP
jgi:hypothetical protein